MRMMLPIGGLLGLIAVIMGAMADHAFDMTPAQAESMDVAIRYHMLYAVLIVVLSLPQNGAALQRVATVFAAGTTLFSGSIYLSVLGGIAQITYVTPLGGMTLMGAWLYLMIEGWRHYKAI